LSRALKRLGFRRAVRAYIQQRLQPLGSATGVQDDFFRNLPAATCPEKGSSVALQVLVGDVILRTLVHVNFGHTAIRGVLHPSYGFRFQRLPFFDKLLDALRVGVGDP
jgi:hypothetical protein